MTPRRSAEGRDHPGHTWRSAFVKQARSDYEMFRQLNRMKKPLCHQLHYLQMTTEKLAKAFLCDPNSAVPPPRVHGVLTRFMRHAKDTPTVGRACGLKGPAFRAYVNGLLPIAQEIERLAPVGDMERPNPEYPWEQRRMVVAPVEYDYPSLQWRSPGMRKMLQFIDRCFAVA